MKRKYPRSVRGAKRQGWYVLTIERVSYDKHNISYLGLQIWAERNTKGKYISSFDKSQFAFELERDASWFALKWL